MFRLSQKADYGLILLSAIAKTYPRGEVKVTSRSHPGGAAGTKFVSVAQVAKKNEISTKFLSQIAGELKRAGVLSSREGVAGGYVLAKKPNQIKILDVLKTLDGELVEGKCFEDDHECVCGAGDMWEDMKQQMEATIGSKTVADLVAK